MEVEGEPQNEAIYILYICDARIIIMQEVLASHTECMYHPTAVHTAVVAKPTLWSKRGNKCVSVIIIFSR